MPKDKGENIWPQFLSVCNEWQNNVMSDEHVTGFMYNGSVFLTFFILSCVIYVTNWWCLLSKKLTKKLVFIYVLLKRKQEDRGK